MRKIRRITGIMCIVTLFVLLFSGCIKPSAKESNRETTFGSYREIPGVTEDEVEAIEALKNQYPSFVYGSMPSTEAFLDENGNLRGYSALFCEWLTGLFGIPFIPSHLTIDVFLAKMASFEVDFTGDMTPSEERRKVFFMTDAIAEHVVRSFRIAGSEPLELIAQSRRLRYAFVPGSTNINDVTSRQEPGTYEVVLINNTDAIYNALKNGEIDVFFSEGLFEAVFDSYGDVVAKDFFPLTYAPVSLTTQNPALKPIIDVVQKALENGAMRYLTGLYNRGYREYQRHKLFLLLSEEELVYIQSDPVVSILSNYDNYPLSFYNTHENQWQGCAFDVLEEIEMFTGISFKVVNDSQAESRELLRMLQNREALMITELPYSRGLEGLFLRPGNTIMTDHFALLSKSNSPRMSINEVLHGKVGLVEDTAATLLFNSWFPVHSETTYYKSADDAFKALENYEVDVVMATLNNLLMLTNLQERSDYKANIVFDAAYSSTFGFNKDEEVLCSIVDKALTLVDTKAISEDWVLRIYDYQAKLVQAQRPWIIGAIIMSLIVLTLVSVLLIRSRNSERRLGELVKQRTGELELRTEEANMASRSKTAFLANMSHEMRTPMNVVVGLTDLMLDDDDPVVNLKENLKKISTAGNTLLGLINDVLDISKIEAGKLELMPVQYELPSLLNDIIMLNMIRIEDKAISFSLGIDEELPCYLFGDDLRVKQIINNLLSNAFKYTQKGTVKLGISCEQADSGNVWMSAYISDTGIGIRGEDLKKLFSDYSQVNTQANRRIVGTGLGLSITKMLVEHMGGEISVESEYGKGSVFRFRIRQGYVSDKVIGKETAENLRGFHYQDSRKRVSERLVRPDLSYASVLVVDDMQTNLDVAAGLLKKYKMRVDCVLSGKDAIDRISGGEPLYDAIFMDHMMPGMEGVEATEKIRGIGTKYAMTIPIIALTANAIAGNEQMFISKDFQAFLPKPINIMTLDFIVQRWVRDKSRE